MHVAHYRDAAAYVDYSVATVLMPVEDLDAQVWTHRDAEQVLTETPADDVVAVRPTGMPSGVALTQRPLAAIDIRSVNERLRTTMEEESGVNLGQYELLQVGRATSREPNRSLSEF